MEYAAVPMSPYFKIPKDRAAPKRRKGSSRRSTPKPTTEPSEAPKSNAQNNGKSDWLGNARAKYVEILLQKAEAGDTDPDLLNRIETLLGFENKGGDP